MTWNHFIFFAIASVLLWAAGALAAWKGKNRTAVAATVAGLLVFFSFIIALWMSLERPPLRTMGEPRLWFSCVGVTSGFSLSALCSLPYSSV